MESKEKTKQHFIGWIIIAVALFSAIVVYFTKGLTGSFLALLILNIAGSVVFRQKFSKSALAVCRILIGLLFIFSGFVKAIDPMGTVFKMEEYMGAYGTEWANPLTPVMAILMISIEFTLGWLAVLNIKPKTTLILITLMMAGFTCITFLDAISNPVSDCGCFGDIVIMSNWQTFYKNLIINAVLLGLLCNFKKSVTSHSKILQFAIGGFIFVITLGIEIYTYCHLPLWDTLPWKTGSATIIERTLPVEYFYTCKNKQTGVIQEFPYRDIAPNLTDSAWNAQWEILSRRDIDPNQQPHNMRISTLDGEDITASYLETDDPTFIVSVYNMDTWHSGSLQKIGQLYQDATNNGFNFVFLIDADPETAHIFIKENNIAFPVNITDATELKMMNRSNPGVTFIQNKTVIKKWDYHHVPDAKQFNNFAK